MRVNPAQQSLLHTLPGVVAILLWSSSVAFSRGVAEKLGALDAGAATSLLGGGLGLVYLAATGSLRALLRQPRGYLLSGSLLITLYLVCLYLAVGMAATHQQVVEVGLINYLWPGLTLLLSVPMLRRRARIWLLPGVLIAFAGVVIATLHAGQTGWAEVAANVRGNAPIYLLALTAAVTWAVYSNLIRRWADAAPVSGIPLFIFVAGLVMMLLRLAYPAAPIHWTPAAALELLYLSLGPTLLGYLLWDAGVRRGRLTLLASLSNLTPLFSTLISSLYLGVALGPSIWVALACIIAGALLCNYAIPEASQP